MKGFMTSALVLMVLLVAYNLYARSGGPEPRPDIMIPWLAGHRFLMWITGWLLKPGSYALWYLGLDVDTRGQIIVSTVLSWWAWLIAIRLIRSAFFLKA